MEEFGESAIIQERESAKEALLAQKEEADALLTEAREQHARALASLETEMSEKRQSDIDLANEGGNAAKGRVCHARAREISRALEDSKKAHEETKMTLSEVQSVAEAENHACYQTC